MFLLVQQRPIASMQWRISSGDEYALELAFEGTRWYDLMRLARHKNKAGLYGADFGGRWLARKLMCIRILPRI